LQKFKLPRYPSSFLHVDQTASEAAFDLASVIVARRHRLAHVKHGEPTESMNVAFRPSASEPYRCHVGGLWTDLQI
jgi:hypothetical protein